MVVCLHATWYLHGMDGCCLLAKSPGTNGCQSIFKSHATDGPAYLQAYGIGGCGLFAGYMFGMGSGLFAGHVV